jgi:hypothetical protein
MAGAVSLYQQPRLAVTGLFCAGSPYQQPISCLPCDAARRQPPLPHPHPMAIHRINLVSHIAPRHTLACVEFLQHHPPRSQVLLPGGSVLSGAT